jgi:hypothetical protein
MIVLYLVAIDLYFVRGAILTPKEMEDLTEPWKPYRSLGKPGVEGSFQKKLLIIILMHSCVLHVGHAGGKVNDFLSEPLHRYIYLDYGRHCNICLRGVARLELTGSS